LVSWLFPIGKAQSWQEALNGSGILAQEKVWIFETTQDLNKTE
jgi:hypothetical protein